MATAKATGNVYLDPAYVSQEAIDALGGTSSITGEALVFGSTTDDLENGANAFAPDSSHLKKWFSLVDGTTVYAADGSTMYVSNYLIAGDSLYSTGAYGIHFEGSTANYVYGVPKTANSTVVAEDGINITLVDALINFTLAPASLLAGINIIGNFNVDVSGSTLNSLVIAGGTTYRNFGIVNGDINFTVSDTEIKEIQTDGNNSHHDFHIHSGRLSNAEYADELSIITGTVSNVKILGSFRSIQTNVGENEDPMPVKAKYKVTITGSSVGGDINIGYLNNADDWSGSYELTVAGSTAANIRGNGNTEALPNVEKFDLILAGSETKTVTGIIDRFKTITIDAGAKVQATSISGATLVNLAQGAEVSVGAIKGVGTLAVTGTYTAVSNTLISGLTDFSVGDITDVTLNGESLKYGFMPGQYSLVGDKLVLHEGETVLVDSSYTDGATVIYEGKEYTGYSSVAEAQKAVTADQAVITIVPDGSTQIGDSIATKDYSVVVQGQTAAISMEGKDFVIGETGVKHGDSTVIITGLSSVGTVSFGDLDVSFLDATGLTANTVDFRGAEIGDIDATFTSLTANEIYLPTDNTVEGTLAINSGSVETIYNSKDSNGKLDLALGSGLAVGTVFAEGKTVDVGAATVGTYYGGLKDGGSVDEITFAPTNASNITILVLGGQDFEDKANTIGSVNAKITKGGIDRMYIGGDYDKITGDVNVELGGPVGIDAPGNGTFTGIVYGADIGTRLNGGSAFTDGTSTLNVTGHAKVGEISGFDAIIVSGGTLNVGDNGISASEAAITNLRTISTKGAIQAASIKNSGVVGASSLYFENSIVNSGEFRVEGAISAGGSFSNSGTIYVNGDLSVSGGIFTNSGVIYASSLDYSSISLSSDLDNTGTIYASNLNGAKNITTSSLFVAGDASMDGDLTVNANSNVAFQNGIYGYGNVAIDATSTLSVGGSSFDGDGKTLTVNVGDMIGYNEILRANDGADSWTINFAGLNKGDYEYLASKTSIIVYSASEVFVNSSFSADSDCIVDGHKLLYGKNAFASVAEAVAGARSGATIVIVGDKSGMDVNAGNFAVVLDGSEVGTVTTTKGILVTSDSKAKSIASASDLTIEAGAVLAVADTIPADLPIVIDASNGSGSRLVLDVDKTKVTLSEDQVTVVGKPSYGKQVLGGESAHAGDLYLISNDVVFSAPMWYVEKEIDVQVIVDGVPQVDGDGNPVTEKQTVIVPSFVDGDFDKATGDALFDGVNVFQTKSAAESEARSVSGTIVIVDHMTKNQNGFTDVNTAFEVDMVGASGNSSIYGGVASDTRFTATGDHTTMILGSTMRGNLYALAKTATIGADYTYTFVMKDSYQFQADNSSHGTYFVARDNGSQVDGDVYVTISNSSLNGQPSTTVGGVSTINGDLHYDISGSTFAGGLRLTTNNLGATLNGNVDAEISGSSITDFYVAYGNIGTSADAPIDLDVTLKGSRAANIRAFRLSEDANAQTVINANLNLTILDTIVTGGFYALYTGDWRGDNNVTLRYTSYNSGSMTVTLGGTTVGGWDGNNTTNGQIHAGDSLTHGRNALQNFNVPTTLHIVKGEQSETTNVHWVMEWETIVIDADATLVVNHDIQFMSADLNGDVTRLPNAGQYSMYKINLGGYEGGTRQIIRANSIYAPADRSNIEMIGNEDISGNDRYEIILIESGSTLKQIGLYDKASEIQLNSNYTAAVHGTFEGSQILYFDYNALNDADVAASRAAEWGNAIAVTGGSFAEVEYGTAATVRAGATVDTLTGTGSDSDSTVTLNANASVGSVVVAEDDVEGDATVVIEGALAKATDFDGSKDNVAGVSTLNVKADSQLGDVDDFDTVKVAKGVSAAFGDITGSALSVYADSSIYADSITLDGNVISIDVTGYTGASRSVVIAQDGIADYQQGISGVVTGEGKENYSLVYAINAETQEGVLSLLSSVPMDVYLNSTYSEETTGTFYNGAYLTYGVNAFSSYEAAAANVGEGYSVIMNGGEFDSITVDGFNFKIEGGTLGSLSAGTGASTLTVDGVATVTGAVEGFNGFTISSGSTLTAEHIDLVAGSTVFVTGTEFSGDAGTNNLRKLVDTSTGIDNAASFVSDNPYFHLYVENNDLYLLDKSRIYVNPSFKESVTGTTVNGDYMIWGVNAFDNTDNAYAALVRGGTVYVYNWGTAGTQAGNISPTKPASIVAQGPTNFSIVYGNNARITVDEDVTIVMDNTGTPQGGSAILNGDANAKWVFNGNVSVTFKGTNQINSNGDFAVSKYSVFNGDLFQINIEKPIHDDIWMIRDYTASDFANLGKLEVNITGMTSNNGSKWMGIFRGDNVALPAMNVELNIKDSVFNGGDWSVGLVEGGNANNPANFSVHLNNSTIQGWISGAKSVKWRGGGGYNEGAYAGTRTLYVDGTKASSVIDARMFHHIVISADATLNVSGTVRFLDPREGDPNSVVIDLTGYTGGDKMFLNGTDFRIGNNDDRPRATADEVALTVLGNNGDYIGGLGLRHGAFVITKNGDVFFNANFTDDDIGLQVGSTYVLIDKNTPSNSNAFTAYADAKAAIDARQALGLERNLNVGGVAENADFYADGYKINVYGGAYANGFYGSDRDGFSVESVDITVTGGLFTGKFGVSDGTGSVTGDARIELAGGTFGTPETETKAEVPVTIDGTSDKVDGTSTLVLSKDLVADTVTDGKTVVNADIVGYVTGFDSVEVGKNIANMTIGHDLTATSITVDASSQLTVLGALTADTITIDATEYVGPSKVIAVSSSFEEVANQPAVTVLGDTDTYDYKYVEDTLYLVSKLAGNVYLNSAWDPDISGTVYNGELLVWGVNATNSMAEAIGKLQDQYTLFITGGQFDGNYTFSGKASIDIRDNAVSIGGLVLGDGSSVKISGITAGGASSIGTIAGVEGATAGYALTVNDETAITSIDGVKNFTFSAGKDITVSGGVTYVADGGSLTVDFAGYTQTAETATLLDSEVANFLQPVEGQTFSRTTVGSANNDALIMPYYDEEKKAVIGVKAGQLGIVVMPDDERNNNNINGQVVTIDGITGTMVYNYNLNQTPETVATYIELGGTIYADGVVAIQNVYTPYFFTNKPLDAVIKNSNISGLVVGYDNGDQYHGARYRSDGKTRYGAFNFLAENTTFNWYTNIAAYGYNNGTDKKGFQRLVVADLVPNPDDPDNPGLVDTQYNITIDGCTNGCDVRIAENSMISGGTVNVNLNNLQVNSGISLFRHTYNGEDGSQLKELNVSLTNTKITAQRWIYAWDVDEDNSTTINMTIKDTTVSGGTDQSIGIFGQCQNGTWSGEATVTISGFTTEGRLSAHGEGNNDSRSTIAGKITVKVEGENYIRVLRGVDVIDIADGVVLGGAEIRLADSAQFILRGETGYTGDAKEYVVVGTTITGINKENAFFQDEDGYDIEGYKAVIGSKSVFVYKTAGDVFLSNTYTEATTGTYVTESDGTKNILVYGDNAVSGIGAASASMDARGEDASLIVLGGPTNFEARGYRTVFEGGKSTNVWGGYRGDATDVQETVSSANITVNSGATVTNIYAAAEMAMVSHDANITIGDGTAILGVIDGADNFVGGESYLTFAGTATVGGDVLGFKNVYVDADGLVSVTGAVSDTVIVIDTTNFDNSSKIVMTSEAGFADGVTAVLTVAEGFEAKFSDDRKSLMVVSPFVGDTYFNSEWDSSITGTVIDGVELVWNKNAFDSIADAITAVGQDYSVIMDGGVSAEDADLNGHDFVAGGTQVGKITSAGATLTVTNTLTAGGFSGFSAINMSAATPITVTGAVALAEDATLTIDATGYKQDEYNVTLISAGEGITNLTRDDITINGSTAFRAYVSQEDGNVHMVKVTGNVFFSTEYSAEATQGVKDELTGEILFFGENAFNTLDAALNSVVEGGTVFAYNVQGAVNPSGTTPMNLHLVGGTVTALRIKSGDQGSSTQQVNVPITLTVDGTYLDGGMDYILGRGNTYRSVGASLAYYEPVTINLTGGTNNGNIRFVGQWSSILGDITLNMTDWEIRGDIKPFAGDARFGSDDTGLSKIVWNWENVTLPTSKWIAIANVTDWGAQKAGVDGTTRQSMDAIEFNIKNSYLRGSTSRVAALVEGNDGRHNSNTDITFSVENSTIDCLLTASVTTNLTNSTMGVKTLKISGSSSYIQWANWFQILDIASADTYLSGATVTFQGAGVINVDATGYDGASKVLISLTGGFQQTENQDGNPVTLNLTQDGTAYELVYAPKALVLKLKDEAISNVYVNSAYAADVTGSVYPATGDILFFNENAFTGIADALAVLPADGGIYVTGGSVTVAAALPGNNLTIDAGANLTYTAGVAITITDAFENNGVMAISTEGFDLSSGKALALSAGSISGTGVYQAFGDDRYLVTKQGNSLFIVMRKDDVYVNTQWANDESGAIVTLISGETATVGIDAFGSAIGALNNVMKGGTITIEGGTVTFGSEKVDAKVTALAGVIVDTAIIEKDGSLTVSEGATASNVTVRTGGSLTVNAGAIQTGTLALGADATATINGTLDFNLVGVSVSADPIVTNINYVGGTPTYTITVDATQTDGTYSLASGAAEFSFTAPISVKTSSAVLGQITALDKSAYFAGAEYTLSVTEGVLTLTKETKEDPGITLSYVNSEWEGSETGAIVIDGGTFGYNAFATGDEAIAAIVDYGEVDVVGGTVSFKDAISKTVSINSSSTLVGNATFATAVTINGTVAFDTAFVTEEAAQFAGFSFVSGDTKYTLADEAGVIGEYKLASGVTEFTDGISFAGKTLTVGGEAVVVDDLAYSIAVVGTDLVLSVEAHSDLPAQAFVNSAWSAYSEGEPVEVYGSTTATIGIDAFATLQPAIAGTSADGKINVVGGGISFADGYSKTITVDADAYVYGTATFDKPITINGLVLFDITATSTTEAQFKGFSNVTTSESTTYILTADLATELGTYLLASDAAGLTGEVSMLKGGELYTLKIGGKGAVIGDYVYSLGFTDNDDLALKVSEFEPQHFTKGDRDGNGTSDVMFVRTKRWDEETQSYVTGNHAHGYWMNGKDTWWTAAALWISPEWDNLGSYDMDGDGCADAVMFGNVTTESGIKGAYIGFYRAGDDVNGWQHVGYLYNAEDIAWQTKVGNMTGNYDGKNSIVWFAPERSLLGFWKDGTDQWVGLSLDFAGNDWSLAGCGDFDGDGRDSVLMSYNGGQLFYSVDQNGVSTLLGTGVNNWSGWDIRAIGDFAGDGKEDIVLFHEATGSMVMLADGNPDDWASIGQLDPTDWFIAGCGDYNGDQKDELLVRQYSTGMLGYYNNGVQSVENWTVLGYGVTMEWTVIA
jgi:autotransporter passenger strand-loop-strand repeat protein